MHNHYNKLNNYLTLVSHK